jgi:hypothetical protein
VTGAIDGALGALQGLTGRGLGRRAPFQALECRLGMGHAFHAGGSEEDDGVLDVLLFETPQGLEIFRQNPDRPCFVAFEEFRKQVGRVMMIRHDDSTLPSGSRNRASRS